MLNILFLAFISLSCSLLIPSVKQKLKLETQSQLWVLWLFSIFFIAISFVGVEESLFFFMLCTSIFYFYDMFFLGKTTKKNSQKNGQKNLMFHLVDFFPVLIIIWVIRSFIFQPYQVPTGSLEPTVRPGDFLLVNQFDYGIRFPIWRKLLMHIDEPKRGDVVVFFPPGGNIHFVKRLIGLPGDVVQYKQKQLIINDKKMPQTLIGPGYAEDPGAAVIEQLEKLDNVEHRMFLNPESMPAQEHTWIVPQGHYFMMGDNRDFSGDSREFGFVPEKNIVGRPMFIWFSFDAKAWQNRDWLHLIRWHRIGKKVT